MRSLIVNVLEGNGMTPLTNADRMDAIASACSENGTCWSTVTDDSDDASYVSGAIWAVDGRALIRHPC